MSSGLRFAWVVREQFGGALNGPGNGQAQFRAWPRATLLGRMNPTTSRALLGIGTGVLFPPDRVIIRQGDRDSHVYLLLSGIVKVTTMEADQESMLAVRVSGDMVGEMAALERRPRSASVVTSVETRARIISRAELTAFIGSYPDAALELMRMMSERLRWSNSRRVDITTRPAGVRLSRIILEIGRIYGHRAADGWDLGVALTQAELASLAGVALRTAEKVLHGLNKDGLVARGYRRMVITDLAGLRRAAEMCDEIPH
ncbi:Crp/Fnr family transcriptional regulator [Micromonospora sp. CPCC 205546]|uniref:Crp/Fnr family transcriptional regulator n=1 Tax=Micromonospora TaxID=1873 RepID=UPI002FF0F810